MNNLVNTIVAVVVITSAIQIAHAQNYKAPKINASGDIFDKDGKLAGHLTREGQIQDTVGMKIAFVDSEGNLIDQKTGKKLGKAEKNGNFVAYFSGKPNEEWSTSAPMNGTCLVKDKAGNVKAEVHENYKQFGACAIHCTSAHMIHH